MQTKKINKIKVGETYENRKGRKRTVTNIDYGSHGDPLVVEYRDHKGNIYRRHVVVFAQWLNGQ